ncbi:MAG: hypothetical protein AAF549_04570 [Pseudomonadota bacterium]
MFQYIENGNFIFDEGDEILPDVTVKTKNIKRRVETNEKGYSLIKNLPVNRVTDIEIDENTLPDSFMISVADNVSILPEPGEIIELEFPVQLTGEIDGTVSVSQNGEKVRLAKGAKIDFYPLTGQNKELIQVRAAIDGFFVASQIPPGRYLMSVNEETLKKFQSGTPVPRIVEISPNGDVIYGQDIALDKDKPLMPIEVAYSPEASGSQEIIRLNEEANTQSKLGKLLTAYARKKARFPEGELNRIEPASGDADLDSNAIIETTYAQCKRLPQQAIPCGIQVVVPMQETSF